MNNQFYQHHEFNAWLQPRVSEETYQLLTNTINLLVEHQNTTDIISGMLTLLLNDSEGKDDYDQIVYIREQLLHYSIYALREYGVMPSTADLSLDDQPYLNQCLSALLLILDYEDPTAIMELLDLGNPPIEKLGEVLNLIDPELHVETFMQKTDEVLHSTLERIRALLIPAIRERELAEAEVGESTAQQTRAMYNKLLEVLDKLHGVKFTPTYANALVDDMLTAMSYVETPTPYDYATKIINRIERTNDGSVVVLPHLKPATYATLAAFSAYMLSENPPADLPNTLATAYGGAWFNNALNSSMQFVQLYKTALAEFSRGGVDG